MMMGVQQKRKSSGEQEACQQSQQHHQPHQQFKRRRGKATTATTATSAQSKEVTNAPAPGTGNDESVWIFGLISNIEQLLYNVATNGSSGGQSSGSSTPSSTTSTISSPSSLSASSSASMGAALSSAPTSCGAHHQVPRSPISRQIKFHEYKGPPAAKRQAPAAGSNRSQQQLPGGQAKLQLQVQAPAARCKAPSRSHLAPHTSAAARQAQQPQQQQQQPTRTIAKHQPHQSPQQQARHQQSATNQLTSAAVAPPAPNSNATFSVLSPAAASAANLQPQQQQQIVYGLANTSQAAIEPPRLCAQRQVMASQTPMATSRCLEQPQQQQHQQQQLGDFELAMLQLAAAAAVDDDDEDYHQDKSTRGPDLGPGAPDQVEACQLEPSIAPFACSGVEELLFSEFIDLQDVPMNVDESDWLRKFLPPCNSLGSR